LKAGGEALVEPPKPDEERYEERDVSIYSSITGEMKRSWMMLKNEERDKGFGSWRRKCKSSSLKSQDPCSLNSVGLLIGFPYAKCRFYIGSLAFGRSRRAAGSEGRATGKPFPYSSHDKENQYNRTTWRYVHMPFD
jgi:hypothetical protein